MSGGRSSEGLGGPIHGFDFTSTIFPILPQFLNIIIIISINITSIIIGVASIY